MEDHDGRMVTTTNGLMFSMRGEGGEEATIMDFGESREESHGSGEWW